MSGHSKWSQIKHKKGATDQKRSALFSKLLNAVAIAARNEPNPQFNPSLRAAVERAKENQVPLENIERAVKKASENKNLEELIIEAYGPEGAAIIIEAVTDNRNRTISEIKKILSDNGAKIAEPGSVLWVFEKTANGWQAKFKQEAAENAKEKIRTLTAELENRGDVQKIITNL